MKISMSSVGLEEVESGPTEDPRDIKYEGVEELR